MQPTQTLLELLVEYYGARRYAREQALKAKASQLIEPRPADTALEQTSRFPFLP